MMFLWLMFVGSVLSAPTDEFGEFTKDSGGDILPNHNQLLMNIVPSGFSPHKLKQPLNEELQLLTPESLKLEVINENIPQNVEFLNTFNSYVQKGVTLKGLTFNIYDDNMREAAIALFRLLQISDGETFELIRDWAKNNINEEMYLYALRLESLYSSKTDEETILPPFIYNPHYFVNDEVLAKESVLFEQVRAYGKVDPQILKSLGIHHLLGKLFTIPSNYSGWNLPQNGIDDEINYFREDISLNSYYLGLHLLHPFWMSNYELDQINPRHSEHYYYAHQQLMARYMLEKEHLRDRKLEGPPRDEADYVPYLSYKNGMRFPARSCIRRNWDDEQAILKTIDIAIKECISRGILIMENGTTVSMTDDNHIDVLARLIRANLDSVKVAKIVRSVFGYGGNRYPLDEYTPAPSLLHHPETSLRDPVYWYIMQYMLNYFNAFKDNMEPYDLSQYETDDINVADESFSKITTYFESYDFLINYAASFSMGPDDWPFYVKTVQRRLKHNEISFNFTVESNIPRDVIVRLYLGPPCGGDCWQHNSLFFELDTFKFGLLEGINIIEWSPEITSKYSYDYMFKTLYLKRSYDSYSIHKFPERLLIPRGLEQGLNLTMFIMVTQADDEDYSIPLTHSTYRQYSTEFDSKPLGFPFHRKAIGINDNASNYRFYNITIYHKKSTIDDNGYFSPNLY